MLSLDRIAAATTVRRSSSSTNRSVATASTLACRGTQAAPISPAKPTSTHPGCMAPPLPSRFSPAPPAHFLRPRQACRQLLATSSPPSPNRKVRMGWRTVKNVDLGSHRSLVIDICINHEFGGTHMPDVRENEADPAQDLGILRAHMGDREPVPQGRLSTVRSFLLSYPPPDASMAISPGSSTSSHTARSNGFKRPGDAQPSTEVFTGASASPWLRRRPRRGGAGESGGGEGRGKGGSEVLVVGGAGGDLHTQHSNHL